MERVWMVCICLLSIGHFVNADVFNMGPGLTSLETVPVGNPGNAGELSGVGAGGEGPDCICGSVDYTYNIGKYEVTTGQYTEFLNAVAKTDNYGLYNIYMDYDMYSSSWGCNIKRSGLSGDYTYTVAEEWANRPVNLVCWGDAARFANWLHNGQPTGNQGPSTTEDGVYDLSVTQMYYNPDGSVNDYNGLSTVLLEITRKSNWTWAIPTEDEWYKAAYYKSGGKNAGYFDYPTGNYNLPSNQLMNPDPGNNATFCTSAVSEYDYTIGGPYYRTEVGAHENSDSPYGTFDQGGNIWEWNEAILYGCNRGLRGGSFFPHGDDVLHASFRGIGGAGVESNHVGFRVVAIPEPATLSLFLLGGLAAVRRRKRG